MYQADLFPETLPVETLSERQIQARDLVTEITRAILEAPRSMHLEDAEAGVWNTHEFYPKLYRRHIWMKAGSRVVSHTHLEEHPFEILRGKVAVLDTQGNCEILEAPFSGVTLPNTQRVLHILEDTWWQTTHSNPDDCRDPEVIMARITAMRFA